MSALGSSGEEQDSSQPEEQLREKFNDSVLCAPEMCFILNREEDDRERTMRTITIAAPFWVNNCTGHHLVFSDELSGSFTPHGSKGRKTEVLVPFQTGNLRLGDPPAEGFLPSLLNHQAHSRFRFPKSSILMGGSTFSSKFRISTIAQPKSLYLTGQKKMPDHEAPPGPQPLVTAWRSG
jgi:hypothetical protein